MISADPIKSKRSNNFFRGSARVIRAGVTGPTPGRGGPPNPAAAGGRSMKPCPKSLEASYVRMHLEHRMGLVESSDINMAEVIND